MKRVASLLCLMFVLTIPHAVLAAEGGPIEVSGGYSYVHDQDASSNFPSGWTASVSAAVNPRFGVVGELGGSFQMLATPSTGVNAHLYSFLGGARYTAYSAGKMSVFGQALIGAVRVSGATTKQDRVAASIVFKP